MLGRRRRGTTAAACLLIVGAAAIFGSTSAAQVSDRPIISGDPLVGNVLTVSESATGQALYQWQGCNPDVASCADSPNHVDPNWTDLTSQSHDLTSFTIPESVAGYFIRVVVHDNNRGDKWATTAPVGPVPVPPPPAAAPAVTAQGETVEPEHGISLLVQPTGGTVLIKLPGAGGFGPLHGLQKIPVNSVLDTRGGKVRVTAATGNLGDTTEDESVEFYAGLIRLEQGGETNAPTIARLVQKLRCGKTKGAKASAGGPQAVSSASGSRRAWGSGHGSYGSRGSGGTGSVRGTTWLTKDTCKGTFFKVTEGIGISVFDFDLGKTLQLGPGQSYFAKNR